MYLEYIIRIFFFFSSFSGHNLYVISYNLNISSISIFTKLMSPRVPRQAINLLGIKFDPLIGNYGLSSNDMSKKVVEHLNHIILLHTVIQVVSQAMYACAT